MSVPVSKRGWHTFNTIVEATNLAVYTIRICNNEKRFPKRHRWCLAKRIVDTALDICEYLNNANETPMKLYDERYNYQEMALKKIATLSSLVNIACCVYSLNDGTAYRWTEQILKVKNYTNRWIESDKVRRENKLWVNSCIKTPNSWNGNNVRNVNTDGSLSNNNANNSNGVSVDCTSNNGCLE